MTPFTHRGNTPVNIQAAFISPGADLYASDYSIVAVTHKDELIVWGCGDVWVRGTAARWVRRYMGDDTSGSGILAKVPPVIDIKSTESGVLSDDKRFLTWQDPRFLISNPQSKKHWKAGMSRKYIRIVTHSRLSLTRRHSRPMCGEYGTVVAPSHGPCPWTNYFWS